MSEPRYWRHVSGVSVVECPTCGALVSIVWGGAEKHARWHADHPAPVPARDTDEETHK